MDENQPCQICRVCLSEDENMQSIFCRQEGSTYTLELSEMLMAATQVQISPDDGLPEVICGFCVIEAAKAYEFKQKCENSDLILRNQLRGIKPLLKTDELTEIALQTENTNQMKNDCFIRNKIGDDTTSIIIKTENHADSYPCPHCDYCFLRENELALHINQKHAEHNEARRLICPECKCSFKNSKSLTRHKRIHSGEKPFECDVCKMKFSRSEILTRHKRTHTGEKPYECSICAKAFSESNALRAHIRIHTREKPYECDVCEMKFSESGALTRHKRTHTGVKPYKCDTCKKAFTQSNDLKSHMRIHTGERPYECDLCKKAFMQSNALKVHMRIHTGERPYECDMCKMKFKESGALTRHKTTHSHTNAVLAKRLSTI